MRVFRRAMWVRGRLRITHQRGQRGAWRGLLNGMVGWSHERRHEEDRRHSEANTEQQQEARRVYARATGVVRLQGARRSARHRLHDCAHRHRQTPKVASTLSNKSKARRRLPLAQVRRRAANTAAGRHDHPPNQSTGSSRWPAAPATVFSRSKGRTTSGERCPPGRSTTNARAGFYTGRDRSFIPSAESPRRFASLRPNPARRMYETPVTLDDESGSPGITERARQPASRKSAPGEEKVTPPLAQPGAPRRRPICKSVKRRIAAM